MENTWTSRTGACRILIGDCIESLRTLPDCSVQCCITSPPYWGLRDYGHEGQIGLEKTPEEYTAKMVEVFAEVRRVLREDGVLWLNLGDSYAAGHGGSTTAGNYTPKVSRHRDAKPRERSDLPNAPAGWSTRDATPKRIIAGLKPKDLVGIPWRVAFALQADGWWLRQDIIWHKPNPMPESVTDRCTKAHEYIFLLTKSARYFYDSEAVKEKGLLDAGAKRNFIPNPDRNEGDDRRQVVVDGFRNRRSVWTVSTKPYSGAHFATYPPDLIEPCVKAGTSEEGCCRKCGAAWERVVERSAGLTESTNRPKQTGGMSSAKSTLSLSGRGSEAWAEKGAKTSTLGWQPSCQCNAGYPVPCVVLDPFNGSGTTGAVAVQFGRKYIGCEINPEYVELAKKRISEAEERFGMPLFS